MIQIELKLLKSKRFIIPVIALLLVMALLAFFDYWFGYGDKQLKGAQLAQYIATNATQSTMLGLFFIFWMLQLSIHLNASGFYKMLLTLGWSRSKLYLYALMQLAFYSLIYLLLNFLVYSILGLFYGTNPLLLIANTSVCALINQFLFLCMMGLLGMIIGFFRPNHVMVLPVLIYWLFEGWLSHFLLKKLEFKGGKFLPLQASKLLIGENLLGISQQFVIAVYAIVYIFLFNQIIQKRNFV